MATTTKKTTFDPFASVANTFQTNTLPTVAKLNAATTAKPTTGQALGGTFLQGNGQQGSTLNPLGSNPLPGAVGLTNKAQGLPSTGITQPKVLGITATNPENQVTQPVPPLPQSQQNPPQNNGGTTGNSTNPGSTDVTNRTGLLQALVDRTQPSAEELALESKKGELAAKNAEQIAGVSQIGGDNALQTGRAGLLQGLATQQQAGLDAAIANLAAKRGVGANILESAIGSTAPMGNTPYALNPLTGKPVGGGNINDAITTGANYNTVASFAQDYNQGKAKTAAADAIQNQIVNTINSNNLNSTPIAQIPKLNELISGQISSGPQQQLSQQIANYINTLGLDPASVTQIAYQQKGTLGQLLDSLRATAVAQNEAKNPANVQTGGTNTTSNTSGGTSGTPNPWK